MQLKILHLVLTAILMNAVFSKVFEDNINVHVFRKNGGWHFLGRTTLNPGKVEVDISIAMNFP